MKLADLFEDIEDQHMLLKDWEVMTASHCLKGKLYNRPGHVPRPVQEKPLKVFSR